jgi:hypothetical protein
MGKRLAFSHACFKLVSSEKDRYDEGAGWVGL